MHQYAVREAGNPATRMTLFEVFHKDGMMLYAKLGSKVCSKSAEIRDFKFEYLTHKAMADMNSENHNSTIFKSWQQSITETLSHMTMVYWSRSS